MIRKFLWLYALLSHYFAINTQEPSSEYHERSTLGKKPGKIITITDKTPLHCFHYHFCNSCVIIIITKMIMTYYFCRKHMERIHIYQVI